MNISYLFTSLLYLQYLNSIEFAYLRTEAEPHSCSGSLPQPFLRPEKLIPVQPSLMHTLQRCRVRDPIVLNTCGLGFYQAQARLAIITEGSRAPALPVPPAAIDQF
jgi:hypothetical protein